MESDAKQIEIDKSWKNIFYKNGSDLQLNCTLLSSGIAKLEEVIEEKIKTRSNDLMLHE